METKDCKFVRQFWEWILKICDTNPIKFLASSLELSLCVYFDAYVLVTGNIAVVGANNNTKVPFRNCALLKKCRREINETFIDEVEHKLQWLCTIWSNIVTIIPILEEVYATLKEMKYREMLI